MRDLADWIGRTDEAEDVLTPGLAERFAATLDPWLAPAREDEAPGMIHWCLASPSTATDALRPDGHPRATALLPEAPLPRRMWVGGEVVTHAPLRIGDRVRRHSAIASVTPKQGRSGAMIFISIDHRLTRDGSLLIEERQDLVYREAATATAATPAPAPDADDPVSATLLFRYSALTFNSHRIHYDEPYAREVEGYPGLVVQGPLQATLLYHYAAKQNGTPPARFAYRAVAPLILGNGIRIASDPLEISDASGCVTMTAQT